MFCTYIALFYLLALKALYTASHSPIHTHTHTATHTPMGELLCSWPTLTGSN
ncbi:hypothetical protein EXN66_Car007099 [Channa argus]|uniref:Uncharacterized protein n=1 Tax=Channa argus TaxID=215402 RepID=A0A6G1PMQ0_CHAAH|nr:hypothetical protein EXN66_Car007099 [Channa argus]